MRPILHTIARALFHAGGLGLLTLGSFDSSPLVLPMGNDLLVLALSARYHERVLYYVLMATAGSLIGCFATDWISRKSESGQKRLVSRKHLDYISEVGGKAGSVDTRGGVAHAAAVPFYRVRSGCGSVSV